MENIIIRTATPDDAAALLAIYAPYVTGTAITFEYDVPSLEEFRGRIANTLKKYPYLVAEKDGTVVGYAYAGAFKARAAYSWAVELSIYLSPGAKGLGMGRKLYAALEESLKKMGVTNLYACIAFPETDDEYLTRNSVDFHAHLGFTLIGHFHKCGFKFRRWYDMVWMEKLIGDHIPDQPEVTPFIP